MLGEALADHPVGTRAGMEAVGKQAVLGRLELDGAADEVGVIGVRTWSSVTGTSLSGGRQAPPSRW